VDKKEMKMRFSVWMGAAALALTAVQFGGGKAMAAEIKLTPTNPVVEIQVSEKEEAAPDIAILTTGVTTNGKTAKEAMDANNVRMQPVIAAVKAAGIMAKDIQTTGVRLGAEYDYSKSPARLKGYQASNSVSITVRDLAKLDKIMAAMVNSGANEMNGPNFSIDDPDALAAKARDKVFDKAAAKARAYALKAGFKNVKLLSVSENADQSYVPMMKMGMAAAASDAAGPPIEPGEVSVTVSANFQFEMVP
jgi:uncharacterized protein YggE